MTNPLRVLHLEDSPRDAEVVRHKLEEGGLSCHVLRVDGKESFEAALTREPFDLILSDYNLPGYDGISALRYAQQARPDVPVILISGTVGDEEGVRCLHLGATDYLLKDRLERLVPAVQRAIEEAETRRTRKRAEAALVDLRDAIDQHAIVAVTDARGTITFANDKFCDVSGYSRDELVGQDHRLINSGHHSKEFMRDLWTTIKGGVPWHGEIKNKAKNGSYYWLDTTIVPFLNDDGTPRQHMAIRTVITERKEAEQALRDERDLAQQYLDTAEVILLKLDMDGRIALVNRYGCSLVGWSADELRGRDWFETCVPARMAEEIRTKYHALLGGDRSVIENPILTRSGEERLVEWRSRLLRDDEGHVIGTFSSGTDITERSQAEEEIRHRATLSALGAAVGLALTEADSLPHALQRCAEALVTHVGAAFARIWTLNEREGVLELQASAGLYTHLNGPHGRVPVGQFKIGRIALNRRAHLTNAVIGDLEVGDQEWAAREGMVAFAGHPLIVDDRVVGVIALFAKHPLSDAVLSALASVANHVALGIERYRSVETLRTTEERMRFALKNADVGIWDMDYTTGVLRWSETIEAHYGLQPGTFGGTFEAFVERIHPDDRASLLERVGKAMKAGSDFSVLNRTIWPDGTVRWLSGTGRVLLGEHGEPVRAVGISQDVTERKQAEETRARLAAIVESSDDAIFSIAPDDTILTWNTGAERLYGYTANEAIGRSRGLIVPAGKVAELTAIMERAARGEPGAPFETQRMRKDGSMIDVSLTISPMTDSSGRVTGAATIARDIRSRLKAEAELTRLNLEIQLQRMRVFKATIRTVQDIVNNLLNSFQLVRLEGEGHLPAELLTLVDRMVQEAGVKLKTLGDLEKVNEKEMAIGTGIDYPGAGS